MRAFTLVEIALVLGIVSIIIGLSAYWYSKIPQSEITLDEAAYYLVNILNLAKQKSMLAEENDKWGVWFLNNQNNPDYAHLFKGTTSTIKQTFALPTEISLIDPPINSSKTIVFNKISGETNFTIISIGYLNSSLRRYIIIPTSAAIFVTTTWP